MSDEFLKTDIFIGVDDSGSFVYLLILQIMLFTVVLVSNLIIVFVLLSGWSKLKKCSFYIIVANLTIFTSLKGFVQLWTTILSNVTEEDDGKQKYTLAIFIIYFLADYGILLFSVLIAADRLYSAIRPSKVSNTRIKTIIFCCILTSCCAVFPLLFNFCKCIFVYISKVRLYYTQCETNFERKFILNCLKYLPCVCIIIELILYALGYTKYQEKLKRSRSLIFDIRLHKASIESKLLKQNSSINYKAAIIAVFILSFLPTEKFNIRNLLFAENMLNLLIAAVYPIILMAMPGEMNRILVAKFKRNHSSQIASINLNNSRRNAITPFEQLEQSQLHALDISILCIFHTRALSKKKTNHRYP
ncbi:hypothetical protein PRIPAC_78026 [Pristionchus pacificus]|uniref:G_PROTEIN_RECEP_F1_2 domain-containing protein n=1 Tax=Pristionchus pacificus TaxID=54126 RepID=A0A2A6C2T5_PRIPA|nr:hypothetical protein PRIPAC_78026 [Pristionchus pacificus]|eukprot:PDM72341.1 hypothetical protein PRIPAC_38775 [Pristionchus pacificus]